jgi:RHS repeat-associated protein
MFLFCQNTVIASGLERAKDFIINDYHSNLAWMPDVVNNVNWQEAKNYCANLRKGNYSDWQMPSLSEIQTLKYHSDLSLLHATGLEHWTRDVYPDMWKGRYYGDLAKVFSFDGTVRGIKLSNSGRGLGVRCVRNGIVGGNEPPPPSDNTDPNITITSPTTHSSYSTSASTIMISGDASDQGKVSRIEFYLNGSRINTINVNSTSYNWSKSFPLQRGNNIITAKAYDMAGNSESDTLTIKKGSGLFSSFPEIEIIDAPSTATVGQSYTIRLRATDPNNNLRNIKVDWRAIGNWETRYVSNGQTVSLTYQYPRSGNFTWVAVAVDGSGKESYPIQRSVTVKSDYSTSRYTGYGASCTLRYSQPAQCRGNCLVADPIDTATGAQVLTHELLSVNGVLPISATLDYNSLLLTKGVVGRSWSLNSFDTRLQALPSGDIEGHWSANRSNVFKHQGNGQFSGTDLNTLYDKLITNEDDSFTLTRQNQSIYQFDTNGRLVALSNQQGQALEFKHDDAGRLIQVTEPVSGVFLKYAYNHDGLLETVTDSLNRQVRLGYDSEYNLVTITNAAGKTMTYTYNEFGQTMTGTNGDNVRLFTNTYDSEGRIIAQDDSVEGNQLFRLHYDETSQPGKIITTVTNRNGHTRVFTYDENYQLLSLQDELDKTTRYAYANGRRIRETDANDHITRFAYDSQGNLAAITNANNFTTYWHYDQRGNLLSVTNPLNQSVHWAYDANNRVIRYTDQAKYITHFAYNEHGQLSKITTPKDATTTYTYQQGLLTAITDAEDHTQTFAYDKAGRIISITDADQKTTVLSYDPLDRLRSVTDPLKRTVTMTYDSRDNLVTFTEANSKVIRRLYDGNGNLLKMIDPLNRETRYQFDGEDQLIQFTDAENQTTEMQRDAVGRIVKRISPSEAETQWVYDAVGNVTQTIDALQQVVEIAYDTLNNPIKVIDAAQFATTLTYDRLGRLETVSNVLGHTRQQTYDVRGNLETVQDAKGNVTRYGYDESGNLTSETNALNQTTRYQYDPLDRLIKIIDAKGNKTRLGYDAKGRLDRVIDPLKRKQQLAYDAVDNLVKVTDALGNTVQTHYDALDNPRQITDALGRSTTFAYDAVNRLTQLQDALKRITTFEYDNVDRLIASVDALTGRSSQAFDADGNRTELVDPNHHQTQFEFDAKGRLEAEISSAGGRQAYGYNARDLLTDITNARKQTRHIEYDALGRMLKISDADGVIHYAYDNNGNVLTITDDNGTISREYDALNRVIKYTDSQDNTLHYAYDEVGNLVTLTYPDNRQVHYDYDAANQLIQVIDWAQRETAYEWDDNGRLIKETRPNGTVMTRHYDKAGQLLQQQDVSASGEVIAQFEFSYNPVGNITNETPALKPPILDATLTYTAANQLETYNGKTVKFDADGNMIKGPLNGAMQPFQYDSRNRLSQIADTVYVYDAENQRIAVKSQGKVTHYVINPQAALSQVLVKTAPDGTPTYYVYGLGLIGEETNGAYQAYHYDLRGSTVALTEVSGTVVDRFQYSAFAQLVEQEGTSNTPFLYNGRDGVMTDTNGLYYMRARYYSPEIRRFVNQDPVFLGTVAKGQTLNRYAYVTGQPIDHTDPLGLYSQEDLYNTDIMQTKYNPKEEGVVGFIDHCNSGMLYVGDFLTFGQFSKAFAKAELSGKQARKKYQQGDVLGGTASIASVAVDGTPQMIGGALATGMIEGSFVTRPVRGVTEYSHWVPKRYINPKSSSYKPSLDNPVTRKLINKPSLLNGNHVPKWQHYKHDPFRYPTGWHNYGNKWSPVVQQLDRIPNVYKGGAIISGGNSAYEYYQYQNYYNYYQTQ